MKEHFLFCKGIISYNQSVKLGHPTFDEKESYLENYKFIIPDIKVINGYLIENIIFFIWFPIAVLIGFVFITILSYLNPFNSYLSILYGWLIFLAYDYHKPKKF